MYVYDMRRVKEVAQKCTRNLMCMTWHHAEFSCGILCAWKEFHISGFLVEYQSLIAIIFSIHIYFLSIPVIFFFVVFNEDVVGMQKLCCDMTA